MADTPLTTRRDFLRTAVLGGAIGWTVPSFVSRSFGSLHETALNSSLAATTGRDNPILVVLQLAGGNDGLNTIVPYTNDEYFKARSSLAMKQSDLIRLNDELGVPQNMAPFKELYDNANLAVINGVGYPNPNRSHFRSTEIWHTASDSERFESHGWIGRYFDNQCSGCDASIGLSVGKQAPQAFTAAIPKGVSLTNPKGYDFQPRGDKEERALQRDAYGQMNHEDDEESGGSIMEVGGVGSGAGSVSALDFIERTAMDAQVSSKQIKTLAQQTKNQVRYPNSSLARDLSLVSRLIAGGMSTRIYYLSQGGYDTHANQMGSHARLRSQLAAALKAFTDDLKAQGNFNRVLVVTFSEFGRRVAQNNNGGTDHGTAAPLFLVGPKLNPGILGRYPSLAPDDLDKGDLRHTTDFRSVYATVLQQWMGLPAADTSRILGRQFPTLPLGMG